jgi:hypothetical protein
MTGETRPGERLTSRGIHLTIGAIPLGSARRIATRTSTTGEPISGVTQVVSAGKVYFRARFRRRAPATGDRLGFQRPSATGSGSGDRHPAAGSGDRRPAPLPVSGLPKSPMRRRVHPAGAPTLRTSSHRAYRRARSARRSEPSARGGPASPVVAAPPASLNGAICGALLGAVMGRNAFPMRWRNAALTHRPIAAVGGAAATTDPVLAGGCDGAGGGAARRAGWDWVDWAPPRRPRRGCPTRRRSPDATADWAPIPGTGPRRQRLTGQEARARP